VKNAIAVNVGDKVEVILQGIVSDVLDDSLFYVGSKYIDQNKELVTHVSILRKAEPKDDYPIGTYIKKNHPFNVTSGVRFDMYIKFSDSGVYNWRHVVDQVGDTYPDSTRAFRDMIGMAAKDAKISVLLPGQLNWMTLKK